MPPKTENMNRTIILIISITVAAVVIAIGAVNFSIINSATHICSQEADDGTTYHFYMVDEYQLFVCKYYLPAHNAKYYVNGYGGLWQDPLSIKCQDLAKKEANMVYRIQHKLEEEGKPIPKYSDIVESNPILRGISEEIDEIMKLKSDPTYFANACIEYHMNEVNAAIKRAKTQPERDRQREEEKKKAIQSVVENINCN